MKNQIATVLFTIITACGSENTKTDTMGDSMVSAVELSVSNPVDSGSDSSVDIAACLKDFNENCEPPCLALEHHSSARQECLDSCVILYKRCTHCPSVDVLNQ